MEYSGFDGATVPICTFTLAKSHVTDFTGSYIRLSDFKGSENQAPKTLEAINNPDCGWFFNAKPDDFKKIPGSPIAYWIGEKLRKNFEENPLLSSTGITRKGMSSGNNDKLVRLWSEVSESKFIAGVLSREDSVESRKKWFPYANGGGFRKWYGNIEDVINWENDGYIIQTDLHETGRVRAVNLNLDYIFKEGIFWSDITSASISARLLPSGSLFSSVASSLFSKDHLKILLAFINSNVANNILKVINPTLHFNPGNISTLPIAESLKPDYSKIEIIVNKLIYIAKSDWDSYEISWDFTQNPIIRTGQPNLEQAFNTWQQQNADAVAEMKRLEEENNKLFIDAYGLQDELTPDVPDEQITLARADREKDSQRLVSYALGCMMGRYSLDEPGLIYAHAGNQDFDANRYQKFPADADGIIPLTEMHWFEDDATHRIQEFLTAVWGKDTLDANMLWLAESLDKKASETAEDTIRRYLASKFYKDHMQTYKKRPIYWLFSSGKQGAFQALVYLHRYNESTLARTRTEYVMPLISKMSAMANSLQSEIENSDSAAEIKRIEKKLQDLHKQQAELSTFEEKLRHYADQRISLDLDDGVKVNYGKFGDLLAEVKAITGEK